MEGAVHAGRFRGARVAAPVLVAFLFSTTISVVGPVRPVGAVGGSTVLVSSAQDGSPGNGNASQARIAAGGALVVFSSAANNLLAPSADTNGVDDVFVKVIATGFVELITVAFDGSAADGDSYLLDASVDGRYVLFSSSATNLTSTSLPPGQGQTYVRDRNLGTTELIPGAGGVGLLSGDGRYVFFGSSSDTLVPGQAQDNKRDVFRFDRVSGDIDLVGRASDGTEANAETDLRFLSRNGTFVGLYSFADNLVPADTNGTWDVFVRDVAAGQTERISVATGGSQTSEVASEGQFIGGGGGVSDDGNLVLFDSKSSGLAPGDTNGERDVFLRDRNANTTVRINVKPDGSQANGLTFFSRLTANGAWAAFPTFSTDMVPGTVGTPNAIVGDLTNGTLELVSQGAGGPTAGVLFADAVDVSPDGRFVSFISNTGSGGPPSTYQVYLRDRSDDALPPAVIGVPDRAPNAAGWYNAPVTIDWQANDPDPSSGTPSDPSDTLANIEGEDVSWVSEPSCDPAGNCATGTLTISLDMQPPTTASPTVDPSTFALGGSTTIHLPASDTLSGLAGGEAFVGADPGLGQGVQGDVVGGEVRLIVGPDLSPGSHTISVRAVDAAGNWSATRTIVVRVTGVSAIEACNFEQDASESADAIRHYVEQGRTTVTLCRGLPVDIATPGRYGPKTTGTGFNESETLAPGLIPAGTSVRSYLVHADRAYPITKDGDYLYRQLGLQFTGGTVLGIVVRDATLNTTDLLGAPGTILPTGTANRGHEVNVRSGKTKFLNKDDVVVLSADRTVVGLGLQVGEAMDEIRIITTGGAVLASSSVGFRVVPPPPSLLANEFNTEICQGSGAPRPQSCNTGTQNTSDDVVVLFEQTDQDLLLRNPLTVNISQPGTYNALPAATTIAALTPLRSHLLHVDRPGPHNGFPTGDFAYFVGSITFDHPILGVVTSDAALNASDLLGASGTYYPTGTANRGADFGLGAGFGSDEQLTLSEDRLTLTVQLQTGNGLDELRVITAGGAAVPSGFVEADGTGLALSGEPWYLYGASTYHTTNRGGPNDPDQIIGMAQAGGLNTLRIGEMFDQINGVRAAPYDEADWARTDLFLDKLRKSGMRAILDLSAFRNHLVHRDVALGGWADLCKDDGSVTPAERQTVDFGSISPYRVSAYAEWDRFLAFVANRVNTVNGIPYRHDPTIAVVSIAGEPNPPDSFLCGMPVDGAELTSFFAHAMAEWKAHDPRHLLSNGGFIHLDWEELHGDADGSGIDWQAIFSLADNDLPSLHTYVGRIDAGVPVDYQTPKVSAFVTGLGKPWFTEEFGWRQDVGDGTRAGFYQWLYDRQAMYGSSGAAFWNLGVELAGGTFDVSPSTPLTWAAVQSNAP
jgi:hypothetical protein